MKRFLTRIADGATAAGQPLRRRLLRVASEVFMLAAVVLLGSAAVLAINKPPTKKALPTGVVFNIPIATAALAPTVVTTRTPLPRPEQTVQPEPTDAPTIETAPEPAAEPPTPEPTPPPNEAPVAKLTIPAIKVDAPISVKGVDRNGVMEDPNSWNDVAYYNFSGRPGFGSGNNAVFAGHVDYIHHGAAVFWELGKLKAGDDIHILLQDGTDYAYRVTQMVVYNADKAPVEEILGDTPNESVTLITCDGTFAAGHYNNRLVVRAERLDPNAPARQQGAERLDPGAPAQQQGIAGG